MYDLHIYSSKYIVPIVNIRLNKLVQDSHFRYFGQLFKKITKHIQNLKLEISYFLTGNFRCCLIKARGPKVTKYL